MRFRRAYRVTAWALMLIVAPLLFLTDHWVIALWALSLVLTWGILAGYGSVPRKDRKAGSS